jgi:hypothetical protein
LNPIAASRKREKYSNFPTAFTFSPIAFVTLGPIKTDVIVLLKDIGLRRMQAYGDRRASEFLFRRLSLTVERFNSVLREESFVSLSDMD